MGGYQIVLEGRPVTLDELREVESVAYIELDNGKFSIEFLPSQTQIGGKPCPDDSSSP